MPTFIRDTIAHAKQHPLWAVAFVATVLLPLMLIFARAGIEVCSGIIGLSFLYHCARTKQWAWLREPFPILCLIAWAWLLLVVTPLAVVPKGTVTAAVWFRFPLMFVALRYWVLSQPAARTTLATILAAILALIAFDSIWQFVNGVSLSGHPKTDIGRLTGPFNAPKVGIFLSKFMIPVLATLLAAAIVAHKRRMQWVSGGLFVLFLVNIILSGERTAFIVTLLASGTAMGLMMLADKRMRIAGVAAALALIGLVAALYQTSGFVQQRGQAMVHTMQHYWQSDYGLLAKAGIDIGKEHWVHGGGLRSFNALSPDMMYDGKLFHGMHPHNAYIEWFAETGLPGVLLFIAMIAALGREALLQLWNARGLARFIPAVLLGMLVQNFFPWMGMQSYFINWSGMMQWYTLALGFAMLPPRQLALRC